MILKTCWEQKTVWTCCECYVKHQVSNSMWNWFCYYLVYPLVALIFGQSRVIFGFSYILQSSKGMRWKTTVLRQHLTCVLEIVTSTMCQAYLPLSILETKITPYLEKEFIIFDGGLSSTWKRSKGEFGKSSVIPAFCCWPENAKPLKITSGSSLMATGFLRSETCTSLCSKTVTDWVGGMWSFWSSKYSTNHGIGFNVLIQR